MKLVESMQFASGFVPVDMSAGANNGDWINMKMFDHLTIIFFKAAGTAGDDPTLKLQQAKDNAAAGAKDLPIIDHVYVKQGADLTAIANFTDVAQAAATSYTDATSAEVQAIWVVEIDSEQLDSDGGYTHVQASVADVGANAQLGCILAIGSRARREGKVANMPSAID